jgi:hypothetical protein
MVPLGVPRHPNRLTSREGGSGGKKSRLYPIRQFLSLCRPIRAISARLGRCADRIFSTASRSYAAISGAYRSSSMRSPSYHTLRCMTADSAALGQCIYCYERFPLDELGDEHIVPLNLGGNLILPHASCSTCGEKTSAAEGHCARAMYADLRAQLGIRGRKSRRARVDMPVFLREEGNGLFP